MDQGIGPDNEFDDKDRFFREPMLPNESGKIPLRLFEEKFKILRFLS